MKKDYQEDVNKAIEKAKAESESVFEKCDVCGSDDVKLVRQATLTELKPIPDIGCGNPFHYIIVDEVDE